MGVRLKLVERDAKHWCVHRESDGSHLGVLEYQGDMHWRLDDGNDGYTGFSSETVDDAKAYLEAIDGFGERKSKDSDDGEDEDFTVTAHNFGGFISHQMDGNFALARTMGSTHAYVSALVDHLATVITKSARNDAAKVKDLRQKTVDALDLGINFYVEKSNKPQVFNIGALLEKVLGK